MRLSRMAWMLGGCAIVVAACSSASGLSPEVGGGGADGATVGGDGSKDRTAGSTDGRPAASCVRAADAEQDAGDAIADGGPAILARIEETGSTNTSPIEVVVYSDGSAQRRWGGAGCAVDLSYPPGSHSVTQFLSDLPSVGDVSQIPTVPCSKSASFGTETTVTAGDKTSGDLQCLAGAASNAARDLEADVQRLEDGR